MTINDATTLISTVGFPICMCGVLVWYVDRLDKRHAEESTKMSDAITALKLAVQELTDRLKGD